MADSKKSDPVVTAPLVFARTADGGVAYLYRGASVAMLDNAEVKRLTDAGMVGQDPDAVPGVAASPVSDK